MTLSNGITLFGAMLVLAAIPSSSVLAVVARSLSAGFRQGLMTALGIVAGDFIFILLAMGGLAAIAKSMTVLFLLVKFLGSAYLIWLGILTWRVKPTASDTSNTDVHKASGIQSSSAGANFLTGLLITLGDQKAIVFYIGFFPAFLDLSQVAVIDVVAVLAIAALAVGGPKIAYAYLADRSRWLFQSVSAKQWMNRIAGLVMIATGVVLIANR